MLEKERNRFISVAIHHFGWPHLTFTLSSNLPRQIHHRHRRELRLAKIHSKPLFCFALACRVIQSCRLLFPPLRASTNPQLSKLSKMGPTFCPFVVILVLLHVASTAGRILITLASHFPFLVQLLKVSMQNMRLYWINDGFRTVTAGTVFICHLELMCFDLIKLS